VFGMQSNDQKEGTEFLRYFMGLAILISNGQFQKAIENENDKAHGWALETKTFLEGEIPKMKAILTEGARFFGPEVMKLDMKSFMMKGMQMMIGGAK
jgi:hypothetical protein